MTFLNMGKILVKKFLLSRTGIINSGQDAMTCNFANGRFAVADGVTNSFHPEFVAQALCKAFVDSSCSIQEWEQQLKSHILNDISDFWAEKVDALAALQTGRQRRHIEINRENLPMGSSTFAGIEFNLKENILTYCILGDSSLFFIPQKGDFSIVCSSRCEERDGRRYVIYDNTPACISNFVYNCQGKPRLYFDSQWKKGEFSIVPGYVTLLTDGAAQWLQDALIIDKEAINRLWNLNTEKAFIDFVSEQRVQGKMDDDIAIFILKIDSETNDGFEEVIVEPDVQDGNVCETVPVGDSSITEILIEEESNLEENVDSPLEDEPIHTEEKVPITEDTTFTEDVLFDGQEKSEIEEHVTEVEDSNQQEYVDDVVSLGNSTVVEILDDEKKYIDEEAKNSHEDAPASKEEITHVEENKLTNEYELINRREELEIEESVANTEDHNQSERNNDAGLMGKSAIVEVLDEKESNLDEYVSIPFGENSTPLEEMTPIEEDTAFDKDAVIDEQRQLNIEGHLLGVVDSNQQEDVDDTTSMKKTTVADIVVEEDSIFDKEVPIPNQQVHIDDALPQQQKDIKEETPERTITQNENEGSEELFKEIFMLKLSKWAAKLKDIFFRK